MAQFYKILKADPLGEPWTPSLPGAKPIQNWWCQVEGEELDVSIGKQVGNTLAPGQQIYGDLVKATSQKGTVYWKFKSVKVPDGVQRPASTPAQTTAQEAVGFAEEWADKNVSGTIPGWFIPFGNAIIDIQKDLKLLKGDDYPEPAPKPEEPKKGVEPISDNVDPETQATLDEIFSPAQEAEDTPEEK